MKNVTYHNPIHQEENTPLVTITETNVSKKQSTAVDSRNTPYAIDLAKASFGGVTYPSLGSQWYLKKISGVWTLMARGSLQNPQANPTFTPVVGETYIGHGNTVHATGDFKVHGALTVSGASNLSSVNLQEPTAASPAISIKVTGDANNRLIIGADGKHSWGDGTLTQDTTLYRFGPDVLASDDEIRSVRTTSTDSAISVIISGDSVRRLVVFGDGKHEWGPGNTGRDTTLYRSAVGTLKTDGSFLVGTALTTTGLTTATGGLTVGSDSMTLNTAWTSFTTTWGASTTNPVIGNGTIVGAYKLFGKFLYFTIMITMGSTTTFGSGAYSFTIPAGLTWLDNMAGISAMVRDNSSAIHTMLAGLSTASSGTFDLRVNAANQLSQGIPYTLQTSDFIKIWGFGQIT